MFLHTTDGLIAVGSIIRVGGAERWPHGLFHRVTYQVGPDVLNTFARSEDVITKLLPDPPEDV